MKSARFNSVAEYLATLDAVKAKTIRAIIDLILAEFPELETKIAWNVPTIHRQAENVAAICAFKHHLSYAPWSNRVIADCQAHLGQLVALKHCIQLPVDWSIDRKLVKHLVQARLAELDLAPGISRSQTEPASSTEGTEAKKPLELRTALASVPVAEAAWKALTPIARRDFTSWIEAAKQTKTRSRRIEKACSMLAAGKRRPCCYSIVPLDLWKALAAVPQAKAGWSELAPDPRRDFIARIEAAKSPAARHRRIKETCEKLATGKRSARFPRHA